MKEIKEILTFFSSLKFPPSIRVHFPVIGIPSGDKIYRYEIPTSKYFQIFYQSLIKLSWAEKHPSLLNIMYHMAGIKSCTGEITIQTDEQVVLLSNRKFDFQDRKEMEKLAGRFIRRGQSSACKTFGLSLKIMHSRGGHQNVLFCSFEEGKTTLYLYEPHGAAPSDWSSSVDEFVDHFARGIRANTGAPVRVVPRDKISLRFGLQACHDPGGYCVIISYFWLYCILVLSEKQNLEFIYGLEKTIFDFQGEFDLKKVFINFSIYLSNYAIQFLKKFPNYEEFQAEFLSRVAEYNSELRAAGEKYKVKKLPLKDTETVRTGEEEGGRKADGEECKMDEDCMSDQCVGGMCVGRMETD